MESIQILALVGGISKGSINKKLFSAVQNLASQKMKFENFEISGLPFFSQDLEMDPPKIVLDFKAKIMSSQAILFVSPEYNRSFPGVLKNAMDWGSRPYGKNSWEHKPTGIMGASIGNIGTFGAQSHLRQVVSYLNMPLMAQPEFYLNASKAFDEGGKLVDEKTKEFILKYLNAFEAWILQFQN